MKHPKIHFNIKPATAQPQGLCQDKIRQALDKFKRIEELTEIRILKTSQGTVSGYFDKMEDLAEKATLYDSKYNIFMTLNPVKSELIDCSRNTLTTHAQKTTKDDEIESIRYLLIDLDPMRPTGVSATNKEKAEAKILAEKIKVHFEEQGLPEPFEADSGNGYHLILPVELENTAENVQLLKKCLEALHFRFSTNTAEVDRTTYNPARITKLYGTIACKGENTPERPHRRSELLHVPYQIVPATYDQIKAVADTLPEVCQSIPKSDGNKWDIPELIKNYNLDLAYTKKWGGKHTIYVLATCPWNPEHTNSAAYIIQFDNGGVDAGCKHNSCSNENFQTLKEKLGIKDEKPAREKQSAQLFELISDCDFFYDKDEMGYVVIPNNGHKEIILIRGKKFKQFLQKRYFQKNRSAPGKDGISEALDLAEMQAMFEGDEQVIDKRVAMTEAKEIFYDLANTDYQMVKISSEGCSIVQDVPVFFVRSKNMKEQVMPDLEAKPEELIPLIKKHIRITNEDYLRLLAVNLVTCFIKEIPHPISVYFGEKGASKSTSMRMVKKIVDPAMMDLLSMPTSKEDLAIVLNNHYMPSFDNLETLSAEKSNMLCMAATGGALSKRTLYTDSDETIHELKKPIQLNGINIVATKPDLLDRSITLELERIKKKDRLTEEEIWQKFNEDLPRILGAIFNTLSKAISLHGTKKLDEVGRMADFTYWGYAIAEVMGVTGQAFLDAYLDNQNRVNEEALASNPIATAVMALMRGSYKWSSSVSRLLRELEIVASNEHINTHQKIWPSDANVLSRRLKEVKSNLEEIDIYYEIRHAGDFKRIIITNEKNENSGQIVEMDTEKKLTDSHGIELGSLQKLNFDNQPVDIDKVLEEC